MLLTRRNNGLTATEGTTNDDFLVNLIISISLVLLGGVFAGLTLALMGQDEIYLQVIEQSGEPAERKAASNVRNLLKRGKHWVLVTLLLSNVITNETLPIVLDRTLGGGWPAVVASTVAIVIFGEIIPQSVCVRYGLSIGSMFAPFVLALMYLLYPVAVPTAKLLDYALGEDHGTMYKKAGLKTLVTLHRTMGVERLSQDEVTIISAVLDLKEKPVGNIMTPMADTFTMSADTILDEAMVDRILEAGYSRIPIHAANEPTNFIGMLLVRILISYDPEDAMPVSSFPLATLPETRPDTSCLNILNYFQEGKSHMVLVSNHPGEPYGAIGVLTLEDVIEELIGEEIVDESDVYVDVHRAIRRTQPGPLARRLLTYIHHHGTDHAGHHSEPDQILQKRASKIAEAPTKLGPSNPASNPRMTTNTNVKIKVQPSAQNHLSLSPEHDFGMYVPPVNDGGISTISSNSPYGSTGNSKAKDLGSAKHNVKPSFDSIDIVSGKDNNHNLQVEVDGQLITPGDGHFESQSHRTGGVVESVVNVHGFSKVVIATTDDSEDDDDRNSSSGSGETGRDDSSSHPLLRVSHKH
ncbi:hypothetical protein CANCADRAFT_31458 [Tortispora caseinolytica NRRL Y-17796]|uniref:CNNM transmembrane domain-containing protein n=1 Tax=Tortispora caseinolytica NRRL Y-17796 TaxID=767744 RepID=A0A1E4TFI1_9ASCO|nr:hypothetical protein CANCADRAFT_31458 [Tortispora caseinolytica NRRL Y-17796]